MMSSTSSLERVLAVLDVFSEEHLEWTIDELMDVLGYSRPTLYRYLKYLKEAGFLSSTHGVGYTLGPRIVELDYLLRKSDALVIAGGPLLRELVARRPCKAFVVRWYGSKILCVASESSTDRVTSSYPRGRPMALGRGAIARSIMAYLPRAHLARVVGQYVNELRSVGLGETEDEIRKNILRVRSVGYAVGHGEVTPGVIGVASAIFDAADHPVASCCVAVAGNLVTDTLIDQIGADVREAARQFTAALQESS